MSRCSRNSRIAGRQPFGPRVVRSGALQHVLNELRAPRAAHQRRLGFRRRRRRLDQRNDLVDVRQRDRQSLEHVAAVARLAQVEPGPADDDFPPVREEVLEELLDVEQPRLAVDERDHVHAEAVLQLRELEQVVLDDLRHFAALQLDDDAHAGLVGLVAQVGNAFELLLADELADAHQQRRLVHLIGNLVDDDRLAIALVQILEMRAGAHDHAAASGSVALADALEAVDDPGRREVGRRNDLHQLVDGQLGAAEQRQAAGDRLGEVVRRDVRRHAYGNARRAVDQQVGKPRRQDGGLLLLAVVVRDEVDGFLVDVGQQLVGDPLEPALGVAHGRRVVPVDRPEVALAVDQRIAQREVLGHPDQRVVDRGVPVRVVFPHHVADDARAFDVRAVEDDVGFVHGEQHAPVHRLQSIAGVRQRPSDDDAHRIVEIRMPHLGFQAYRYGFFGELLHGD